MQDEFGISSKHYAINSKFNFSTNSMGKFYRNTTAVSSRRGTVTVRKGATRNFPTTNKHSRNPSEHCTRKYAQAP